LRALPKLGALLLVAACHGGDADTVALRSTDGKEVVVAVEIVRTPDALRRGLMWRDEMAADHGMLFVFSNEQERSFWMKNTPLSLDIIYIGGDFRIVSIAQNTIPYSTDSIPSHGPVRYVLEVNAGFCRRHGVVAGSQVRLPTRAVLEEPPAAAAGR
jgi:uncharacterized membrane protein (UPF0127 family)